jgi:hypothetical protein
MNIIRSAAIGQAISAMSPTKIAVAYLGWGWPKYLLEPKNIEYIVVSTDIGTNPAAVATLVATIGWPKVFLLNQPHAKIYIGSGTAIIGSANLSDNALSGDGLEEIAVKIADVDTVHELGVIADEIRDKAKKKYPSAEMKDNELREMERRWNRSMSVKRHRLPPMGAPDIRNYPFKHKPLFWVIWYVNDHDLQFDDQLVNEKTGGALQEIIRKETYTNVLSNDKVREGDWLLLWMTGDDGLPDGQGGFVWLYAHRVVNNAVINCGKYTTGIFELPGVKKPPVPFRITAKVRDAIISVLRENGFKNLRPDGDMRREAWRAGNTKQLLPEFFKAVLDKVDPQHGQ